VNKKRCALGVAFLGTASLQLSGCEAGVSYEEEDTCMSYEEEGTCVSYEEEDTCSCLDVREGVNVSHKV